MAEQGGKDQRVELRQRFGAQFLGIELQGFGDAWQLGQFHAPAAAFPLRDAFRRDVEHLGDLCLEQRKFFTAPAQQDVQRQASVVVAVGFWFIGMSPFFVFDQCRLKRYRARKRPYFSGRVRISSVGGAFPGE